MNVALAMSTWSDIAVAYWHQVYHQSEESYHDWRRSGMTERFAYEKRNLCGRKAPVPATCDSVEALLRHELLAHLPEGRSRKQESCREVAGALCQLLSPPSSTLVQSFSNPCKVELFPELRRKVLLPFSLELKSAA